MKILVFAVCLLSSAFGLASNTTIHVVPTRPVVIDAPLIEKNGHSEQIAIAAPWIIANYVIENNENHPITLVSLDFTATAANGSVMHGSFLLDSATELAAGDVYKFEDKYIGGLPSTEKHNYSIVVTAHGWDGPIYSSAKPLTATYKFRTQ
jgi:hypothetical protein